MQVEQSNTSNNISQIIFKRMRQRRKKSIRKMKKPQREVEKDKTLMINSSNSFSSFKLIKSPTSLLILFILISSSFTVTKSQQRVEQQPDESLPELELPEGIVAMQRVGKKNVTTSEILKKVTHSKADKQQQQQYFQAPTLSPDYFVQADGIDETSDLSYRPVRQNSPTTRFYAIKEFNNNNKLSLDHHRKQPKNTSKNPSDSSAATTTFGRNMRRVARSAAASSISAEWPETSGDQLDSSDSSSEPAEPSDEQARLHEPQHVASVIKAVGGAASSPNELAGARKLKILRMFGPNSVQNATQNVTLDCMFRFDPKLDQRLIVKWFYENDLEPVYQWIPELNKRVFSDKYERFIDKDYDLSEDLETLLDSYRKQQQTSTASTKSSHSDEHSILINKGHNSNSFEPIDDGFDLLGQQAEYETDNDVNLASSRRTLASRLASLARMGGPKSRQLLELLRHSLHMEPLSQTRFRALRLIRPTSELSGRFTCSVSSLDAQDLHWRQLTIYEPAHKFEFNVKKISDSQYNLSCFAEHVFPRPNLTLYRQLASPVVTTHTNRHLAPPADINELSEHQLALRNGHSSTRFRPQHLAATALRREPISSSRSQMHVSINSAQYKRASTDLGAAELENTADTAATGKQQATASSKISYDIAIWSLVEESSLSSNLVSHFECVLQVASQHADHSSPAEPHYEAHKTLALHRGWHLNSAALVSRSTLLNVFTILASILALALAVVSSLFLLRLFRGHASKNRRIHEQQQQHHQSNGTTSHLNGQEAAATTTTQTANKTTTSSTSTSANNQQLLFNANTSTSSCSSNSSSCSPTTIRTMQSQTSGGTMSIEQTKQVSGKSTFGPTSGTFAANLSLNPAMLASNHGDHLHNQVKTSYSLELTNNNIHEQGDDGSLNEGAYRVPTRSVRQQDGANNFSRRQQVLTTSPYAPPQQRHPSSGMFVQAQDLYANATVAANSHSIYQQQTKRSPIIFIAPDHRLPQSNNQADGADHEHAIQQDSRVIINHKSPTYC